MLYRHGYQRNAGKLSVEKSGEAREFVLAANNALFKVDSEPSPASGYHRRRAGRQDADRRQAGHAGLSQRTPHLRRGLPRLLRGDGVQQEGGGPQGGPAEGLPQDRRARARERRRRRRDQGLRRRRAASTPTTRRRAGAWATSTSTTRRTTTARSPSSRPCSRCPRTSSSSTSSSRYLPQPRPRLRREGQPPASSDREAASQSFAKAIKALQTAGRTRASSRRTSTTKPLHDTYYYTRSPTTSCTSSPGSRR